VFGSYIIINKPLLESAILVNSKVEENNPIIS
jgi:hypothetical protein